VDTLLDALPPGSYLVASHSTPEYDPERTAAAGRMYQACGVPFTFRTGDEFAEIAFPRLAMVDPGVVLVSQWRPEGGDPRPGDAEVSWNGGMGRKR
jgi:S-adenosyl methyltransferase